eukprot:5184510-Alexandrium_andersonii.AAC.1
MGGARACSATFGCALWAPAAAVRGELNGSPQRRECGGALLAFSSAMRTFAGVCDCPRRLVCTA